MNEKTFAKGLHPHHTFGTVINGDAVIGENCMLHGKNCIGNDGYSKICPRLGNNIRLGVGASVIGNLKLADDIRLLLVRSS